MTSKLLEDQRTVWVVAVVSFLLFLIGNLPWQLDDYDQAKQAYTPFEMIKEGRWFYQQKPHQRVATKPPLVGWFSAGLFAMTRSWEVSWRLPSLLAAIALAVLLFRTASAEYGSLAGLVALSAFGLNLLTPRLATLVRTDMPLTLTIFLMGLLIWQKIQTQEEWQSRDRVCLFALLTIAMLIKGPIVYAFLLPGIALFEWWRRRHVPGGCSHGAVSPCPSSHDERLDTARRLQSSWSGWWPWIASLAVFLLWVTGGILFQPGFFDAVVMREFLGRFGETIHRSQPLYFYLPHLVHKFAPWSILLIGIAIFYLVSRRWRIGTAFRKMSPGTFWLLCWSLGGLIVMSLIASKRVDRIFPVIPPLCLLLAAQVSTGIGSLLRPDGPGRTALRPYLATALLFAILFTGGYTTWKVVTGYRDHRDALAIFRRKVCREADARHWRYEAVSAKDEGLLLYLRKTHYVEPDRAIAEWNRGNLDALIASTEKATRLIPELLGATVSQLKSSDRNKEQWTGYVLITR
ncbi:MAG TPA: glycosyltransferase family 39 protein [Candidatus Udaeobacter sp.]|jgi:4-amino-4-deoxy-L-arabinose transferase-like glycosyltransferase|nr:glycosyltransferase family 39 protein [Candidatus Udaeobacter sp.]